MLNKRLNPPLPTHRHSFQPPVLRFAPLAWLKLQYLCHAGSTEVAVLASAGLKTCCTSSRSRR
jgi:hypothetical protein